MQRNGFRRIVATLIVAMSVALSGCGDAGAPEPAASAGSAPAKATLELTTAAQAQTHQPTLAGMWSDPPETIVDTFCLFFCTDAGIDHLNALLDDPKNDDLPTMALYAAATKFQRDEYLWPRLTAAAREQVNFDQADDPGFLYCEPWGFAREIFAPHQLEIKQLNDRVELRYGEWEIQRTIYLDGRPRPANQAPSPMGHSVGHYEGEAFVIETTAIPANLAPWGFGFIPFPFDGKHSDQLHAVEVYTRSADGNRLLLSATLEDPWALREPIVLKKVWSWAPDQEISPYEDCERPTEFSRGVSEQ